MDADSLPAKCNETRREGKREEKKEEEVEVVKHRDRCALIYLAIKRRKKVCL